ncbi:stage II sporulation protein [Richelia sinica FACHB-800]|uniref:Anti-sigma factor antagonist n=1 Tax=Richelia sinica FACHB-800 TaxID=1357546 RepID=A0A975Y467_9NOST|nr:STAS domain-containing protein [Richelia sinica]MBD2663584.1 STAS domain-containing protein [Richelia sinica FACHB-800]QXE22861.1 stage II sporulation protein [Richelia sinica FACHB-800]
MSLQIHVEDHNSSILRLSLDGRLDTTTANDLDKSIHNSLTPDTQTVILNLQNLNFISSAGLRVLAKVRKTMKSREGKVYFINLTPQVQKVFDIVKAVPLSEVFVSTQELDAYLTAMQAEVGGESN